MRRLTIPACALLWLAGTTGGLAQGTPSTERLIAEPMWILQAADGIPAYVWFEREGAQLRMLRCGSRAPACRESAPQWKSLGGDVFASQSGARLVPAWMVPAAGSRTGH